MIREAIVGAALILFAAGCGSQTPTSGSSTATTTARDQAVRTWVELTGDHMQDMGIAMGKATVAIGSHDYAGLATACRQAHDAANFLQGHMPSPDKELTDELQASLSDFDTASHFCIAAVEDNDENEARHANEFISSSEGHLTTATAIRDRIVNGNRIGP